jgi:hypothetical protein
MGFTLKIIFVQFFLTARRIFTPAAPASGAHQRFQSTKTYGRVDEKNFYIGFFVFLNVLSTELIA